MGDFMNGFAQSFDASYRQASQNRLQRKIFDAQQANVKADQEFRAGRAASDDKFRNERAIAEDARQKEIIGLRSRLATLEEGRAATQEKQGARGLELREEELKQRTYESNKGRLERKEARLSDQAFQKEVMKIQADLRQKEQRGREAFQSEQNKLAFEQQMQRDRAASADRMIELRASQEFQVDAEKRRAIRTFLAQTLQSQDDAINAIAQGYVQRGVPPLAAREKAMEVVGSFPALKQAMFSAIQSGDIQAADKVLADLAAIGSSQIGQAPAPTSLGRALSGPTRKARDSNLDEFMTNPKTGTPTEVSYVAQSFEGQDFFDKKTKNGLANLARKEGNLRPRDIGEFWSKEGKGFVAFEAGGDGSRDWYHVTHPSEVTYSIRTGDGPFGPESKRRGSRKTISGNKLFQELFDEYDYSLESIREAMEENGSLKPGSTAQDIVSDPKMLAEFAIQDLYSSIPIKVKLRPTRKR